MGGIVAGEGLSAQGRHMAARISEWLADPSFVRFQAERLEDIDAWFDEGHREHRQVKTSTLRQADVGALLLEFRERNRELITSGRLRRYIIVASQAGPELEKFVEQLRNFRGKHFEPSDGAERDATLETLENTAVELKLDGHFEFIRDHVDFDMTLAIHEGPFAFDQTIAQVSHRLGRLLQIQSRDESEFVAKQLLVALTAEPYRSWSRAELNSLFRTLRTAYREGPPREAGDVITICHQSLKRIDRQVEANDAPELFAERRIVRVEIDHVARFAAVDVREIAIAAHEIASAHGAFRRALSDPSGRVLYYGFPHVPLSVLAGFLAEPHRHVELVEHDLNTGRFAWRPDAPVVAASTTPTYRDSGSIARLRVSISALVREPVCAVVLDDSSVRLDLHLRAKEIGRGTVETEAQARQHAAQIRKMLDADVAGNDEIQAIHIFAAVPVSVAFLIGQSLAHSSLPPAYIYNFDSTATPRYAWRLDLQAAAKGSECVEALKELRNGAA